MIDLVKFIEKLYDIIRYQELWIPVGVVLSAAGYFGFWFGRFFPRHPSEKHVVAPQPQSETEVSTLKKQLAQCSTKLGEAVGREEKYTKLHDTILADESELWRLYEPQPFDGYSTPISASRPKIIVIANNKGGVGKTTLTAGLAAYFERKKGKRVLLVDLDYQGSLIALDDSCRRYPHPRKSILPPVARE